MFVVPLELCVKCYAFVFKSELLRPSHIPYHITIVITNLKKKNPCLRQEKQFINDNVNLNDNNNFSAEVFPPKAGFFRDNSINLT